MQQSRGSRATRYIRNGVNKANPDKMLRSYQRSFLFKCQIMCNLVLINYNAIGRYKFSQKQDALSQSKQLLRCSLVYYTQPPSGTLSLTLAMHLHLQSFYVYVSSYASGKTAGVCRLVWAFTGRMFERYHNLMNWLISLTAQCKARCRNLQKSIYIFVCASVRTCDDPLCLIL